MITSSFCLLKITHFLNFFKNIYLNYVYQIHPHLISLIFIQLLYKLLFSQEILCYNSSNYEGAVIKLVFTDLTSIQKMLAENLYNRFTLTYSCHTTICSDRSLFAILQFHIIASIIASWNVARPSDTMRNHNPTQSLSTPHSNVLHSMVRTSN